MHARRTRNRRIHYWPNRPLRPIGGETSEGGPQIRSANGYRCIAHDRRGRKPNEISITVMPLLYRRDIPATPAMRTQSSRATLEGTARPLYIYADRTDRAGDASAS